MYVYTTSDFVNMEYKVHIGISLFTRKDVLYM